MTLKLKDKFIKLTPSTRLYGVDIPIIAITGGIASGKSSVCEILKEKGLNIINADHLIKEVYKLDDVTSFLKEKTKNVVMDKIINFDNLRNYFYSSKSFKTELETLLYKKLEVVLKKEVKILNSPNVLVYDIPLLFEKNYENLVDLKICVTCSKEKQIERIKKRDNLSTKEIEKIFSAQLNTQEKANKSDIVIDNSSDVDSLKKEIDSLFKDIISC